MGGLRFLTAGESHGPELIALLEGFPAGVPLLASDIDPDLARRQRGYGRGGRMKIENDQVRLVAGVRGGETLGSPLAMVIVNRDHDNWTGRMGPAPFDTPPEPVTRPRPGHADLAAGMKYDRRDLRDILERASARETAARVAAGAACKKLLALFGIDVFAHVLAIGPVAASTADHPLPHLSTLPDLSILPDPNALPELRDRARASDLACADPVAAEAMRAAIREAAHAGDTLGGLFEVIATGVPPGLGSHVAWDRKLDGRIAQAMMSIQAIKGVEIGLGFEAARRSGSAVHDPIAYDAADHAFTRSSNGAGGLEGGVTNGMPLLVRAAMKPIATLKKALASVDIATKEPFDAAFERSDVCAVPAASVIGEAMLALVLADALLEKLGGDSLVELRRNFDGYLAQLRRYA
jgi:chorismate synthase